VQGFQFAHWTVSGFNSTLVRLKASLDQASSLDAICFNSTLVRLKVDLFRADRHQSRPVSIPRWFD